MNSTQQDKPVVLIVDDDPDIRLAIRRALGSSVETRTAASGEEALALLAEQSDVVDLVLSDYDMPGVNGLALLQTVRLMYPGIVRILLTGRATLDISLRCLNERAAHRFVCKPWNGVDLLGTLQLALRAERR